MTSKNSPKIKKPPLSATLRTIPAVDGIQRLRALTQQFGLIPRTALHIDTALDDLESVFTEHNVTTMELASDSASVLGIAAGVAKDKVTHFQPTAVADRLHTYRNLMLAIAALAASTIEVPSLATTPESIYAHAVKLQTRSIHTRRPFTDDEIVLCRVAVYLASQANPRNHTAFVYTLTDAGQVPGETTHGSISDFDDPEAPECVMAAGNRHLAARFVPLDRFTGHIASRHIQHALRAGHDHEAPLTYKARTRPGKEKHLPGSGSATASAQRIIDRLLDDLRLPTGDITASSITQWRIATTLADQGLKIALELSGRSSAGAMLRALGTTASTSTASADDDGESFAAAA